MKYLKQFWQRNLVSRFPCQRISCAEVAIHIRWEYSVTFFFLKLKKPDGDNYISICTESFVFQKGLILMWFIFDVLSCNFSYGGYIQMYKRSSFFFYTEIINFQFNLNHEKRIFSSQCIIPFYIRSHIRAKLSINFW